jgi:TM2 domain-containing membrane protein YozV
MTSTQKVKNQKSPAIAAVSSAFFPGLGFIYIGNMMKAMAYMVIFACLIILQVNAVGNEHLAFAFLMAGFHVFQIWDAAKEAQRYNNDYEKQSENGEAVTSIFPGLSILIIGIIFQIAELGIIRYRDVVQLWPVVLIALGAKFIYDYSRQNTSENEGGTHE